jgi:hypothetical protein
VPLTAIGRFESVDDAVWRLPPTVRDDLGAFGQNPSVREHIEILHERSIETLSDFDADMSALTEQINRFQPHLALQWLALADPPTSTGGTATLGAALNPMSGPAPGVTPSTGSVDLTDPEAIGQAWLNGDPRGRADLMAGLVATVPGFTATAPSRDRPDPSPGSRVVVVAGSTVAVGVVEPNGVVSWYLPASNEHRVGSMAFLEKWARGRAGDNVWYLVMNKAT